MYSVPGEYIEADCNPVGSNWLTCEINETENTDDVQFRIDIHHIILPGR